MALPPILQNLELPVIASPMFILSGPELVIAQCKAGVVGSFPALNARPQEKLGEWIAYIKKELSEYQAANPDKKVAPFAVNQICHASNNRLEADMRTCVEHEVPIIVCHPLLSFLKFASFMMDHFCAQGRSQRAALY